MVGCEVGFLEKHTYGQTYQLGAGPSKNLCMNRCSKGASME